MGKYNTEREARVKKRTFAIILIILALLAAVWLSGSLKPQTVDVPDQTQPTSGLVLLDGEALTNAPNATADATAQAEKTADPSAALTAEQATLDEAGTYTSKEDVSLYLNTYGHLPDNFITKSAARTLGWSGGGLDDYDYGKCIGGDRFGNNEGLLPEARGRQYYECDIDTLHKDSRGAKRIVFSNDGLIYYSGDHYDSFELLYGEP
jgi:guanyl-specific ribonuclease Sa